MNCLQEQRQQNYYTGNEYGIFSLSVNCAREEIFLTHYQHLEWENEYAETIYIEQSIRVTNLNQIRNLKNLYQIDQTYRTLRREKLMELLPVGFWTVKPFEYPAVKVGYYESKVVGQFFSCDSFDFNYRKN